MGQAGAMGSPTWAVFKLTRLSDSQAEVPGRQLVRECQALHGDLGAKARPNPCALTSGFEDRLGPWLASCRGRHTCWTRVRVLNSSRKAAPSALPPEPGAPPPSPALSQQGLRGPSAFLQSRKPRRCPGQKARSDSKEHGCRHLSPPPADHTGLSWGPISRGSGPVGTVGPGELG